MWLHSLDKHNVAPQMFTVEVNESAVVNPSQEMLRDLMELREAGVSIAVDDFGASHASLVSLSNLPIDIAKIDRRLTSRIVPGENEPILDALRTVLTTHGVTPIVQGVEDETQAEWLNARGWQLLQGYYVGSPADPHDLTPLLAEQLAT